MSDGTADELHDDRPIRACGDAQFVIDLTTDESTMLVRLLGELRELIDDDQSDELLARLFPPASTGDEEADAEYHRLMRSELLQSKLAAFELVEQVVTGDGTGTVDEAGLVAFMQSVNSIRLVLGTMLKVSDEPDAPEVMPGFENSREYHLYGYLSWLLESAVSALS